MLKHLLLFLFFPVAVLATEQTPFCKEVLGYAPKYILSEALKNKFENWPDEVILNEAGDEKTMIAHFFANKGLYAKETIDRWASFMLLETEDKYLIAINEKLPKKWIVQSLVHEFAHFRLQRLRSSGKIHPMSVLLDTTDKARFIKLYNMLDELQANHLSFQYIPTTGTAPSLWQSIAFVKDAYDVPNQHMKDFIALFYLAANKLNMDLDRVKIHHLILAGTNHTFRALDNVLASAEYRSFRSEFYKKLNSTKAYPDIVDVDPVVKELQKNLRSGTNRVPTRYPGANSSPFKKR